MLISPIGGAQQTIADTAAALSATSGGNMRARGALITVETAALRYRVDGTAPTASVGHVLDVGDVLELESPGEVQNFQAIRRDAASAVIQFTLFADVKAG